MNTLTFEEAWHHLTYDPITGIMVRTGVQKGTRQGDIVGSLSTKGYLTVRINYKLYYIHRLAWFMMNGIWPANQIDHKNTIKTDNSYTNLRECDNSNNQANIGIKRNNTSGFKGVSWSKKRLKWEVRTRLYNKQIFIGYFDNLQVAKMAYDMEFCKNFPDFARTV